MRGTLFILFLLIMFISYGQVKIGTIEISESVAKDYFLYCYQTPDTISFNVGIGQHGAIISQEEKDIQPLVIKRIIDSVIIDEHLDTVYNKQYVRYYLSDEDTSVVNKREIAFRSAEIKSGIKKIIKVPRKSYEDFFKHTFLIKRKPTEIDFINWFVKNKK